MDQAVRRLAAYLGPIAKIVVKKAAASAAGRKQFYSMLAEHLGSESDRERFLQGVIAAAPPKTGKGK
jgi:serine/threonine-protein kinase